MARKKKMILDLFALILGILAILFTITMIIWAIVK